jgi:hypothetical protein
MTLLKEGSGDWANGGISSSHISSHCFKGGRGEEEKKGRVFALDFVGDVRVRMKGRKKRKMERRRRRKKKKRRRRRRQKRKKRKRWKKMKWREEKE